MTARQVLRDPGPRHRAVHGRPDPDRQSLRGAPSGITLESEPLRVYPQRGGGPDSTLAAQLLGFVNREGDGQYGVEQQYQEILGGVAARHRLGPRRERPGGARHGRGRSRAGAAGEDLSLTIDAGLQLAVEQELLAAWIADKAKSVSAVVMDPYTGEIYAQATYPSYDANEYGPIAAKDPDRFIDPIVSSVYEPGSVFKMMTATAALEAQDGRTRDEDQRRRHAPLDGAGPRSTTPTAGPRAG